LCSDLLSERKNAVTSLKQFDGWHEDEELPSALVEVCVDLAPQMRVRMDRCVGDVPLLEIITGGARLILSVEAGKAQDLGAGHVALAEEFANAACGLRDELRKLVSERYRL
jgi:hypothetical protein